MVIRQRIDRCPAAEGIHIPCLAALADGLTDIPVFIDIAYNLEAVVPTRQGILRYPLSCLHISGSCQLAQTGCFFAFHRAPETALYLLCRFTGITIP